MGRSRDISATPPATPAIASRASASSPACVSGAKTIAIEAVTVAVEAVTVAITLVRSILIRVT